MEATLSSKPNSKKIAQSKTDQMRDLTRARMRDGLAGNEVARRSAAAIDVGEIVARLAAIPYLPIRLAGETGQGRALGFTLVAEKAVPDDRDLIQQAAGFAADERMQRLLARRWEELLSRLRADLTTGRKERPPTGRLGWLGADDSRYRAALSAAAATAGFKVVVMEARLYWDERDAQAAAISRQAQPPGSDTSLNEEEDALALASLDAARRAGSVGR